MNNAPTSKREEIPADIDAEDDGVSPPLKHTGEQPSRRPPDDEPERVGEGELDIGAPINDRTPREKAWEGEADDDVVGADEEND